MKAEKTDWLVLFRSAEFILSSLFSTRNGLWPKDIFQSKLWAQKQIKDRHKFADSLS